MKIKHLLLLTMLYSPVAFAQIGNENEKRAFDYSETKHELAVDIRPLLSGDISPSLFYRKNYVGPKGKTMGFRSNMLFRNSFSNNEISMNGNTYKKSYTHTLGLSIGLERQKHLNEKFIGYGGFDLSFQMESERLRERIDFPEGNKGYFNGYTRVYGINNFWGFKYHFNSRISFSAETGFDFFYLEAGDKSSGDNRGNFPVISNKEGGYFGLSLVPLKALRVSYHF
ncbi:hypothetical protein ACFSKL_08380 [Belliella marina]|uniref:DUF3575 domain-containing protein n=1 Tax=Belliella marina TaxID=1644146 RepID=A0ABW4VJB8_9BACT